MAQRELAVVLRDVDLGTWRPPQPDPAPVKDVDPVFHDFASDWFATKRLEIEKNTANSYGNDLTNHLRPFFKDDRLSQITVAEVDRYRQSEVREAAEITAAAESGKPMMFSYVDRLGRSYRRRAHRDIDTDDPGWIVETHTASRPEPVWDLEQITALIDGHRTGWLFMAGCVANQGMVYDRFDAVVLLSAPVDVILDRVADRANPFGSTAEDRTKIANDLAAFESLLRAGADHEIITTGPVPEVATTLEQVARAAGHRAPPRSPRADRT